MIGAARSALASLSLRSARPDGVSEPVLNSDLCSSAPRHSPPCGGYRAAAPISPKSGETAQMRSLASISLRVKQKMKATAVVRLFGCGSPVATFGAQPQKHRPSRQARTLHSADAAGIPSQPPAAHNARRSSLIKSRNSTKNSVRSPKADA